MHETKRSNVLIAGMGDIGSRLVNDEWDFDRSIDFYAIKRSQLNTSKANMIYADLSRMNDVDKEAMSQLPTQIDCLIYTVTPSQMTEEGYRTAYIDCYANLMNCISSKNILVKRVLFVSSTGVYGQANDEWVNEKSETNPTSFSGKVLVEAESQVLNKIGHHCVRFSGIYGRSDSMIDNNRYVRLLLENKRYAKDPVHYSNRIHIDDVMGSLVFLMNAVFNETMDTIDTVAPIILVSDDEPTPLHQIHQWLLDFFPNDKRNESFNDITMTRQVSSKRCDNQYIKSLGYEFKRPTFREGFKELVEQIKTL